MQKPTLVIMAAGMGSRFGGCKQMTPVDQEGHFIMDFSIYDALRAGFGKIVCVIKEEMQETLEERIGRRVRPHADLVYAYQSLDRLPEGFAIPEGRVKPWGTGHAIWCAAQEIDGPFAIINADDFYGQQAFEAMGRFLQAGHAATEHAMVGYALENTLTENGSVSRGVCTVDEAGHLTDIVERTKIVKTPKGAAFTEDGETWTDLPLDSVVSMNLWGFQHNALDRLEGLLRTFLTETVPQNPLKSEFYLPVLPKYLLSHEQETVEVLHSAARWYGVTYQQDLPGVVAAIQAMKDAGDYPAELWR